MVSNLNLLVKPLKNNIFIDETMALSLLFQEDGKTIKRKEFLQLLDISAGTAHRDQGEAREYALSDGAPPPDGIYSATLSGFEKEGQYDLNGGCGW